MGRTHFALLGLIIGYGIGIMYTAKLATFNTAGHHRDRFDGMTVQELIEEHNSLYMSPFEQRTDEARKERSILIKYGCITGREVNHP